MLFPFKIIKVHPSMIPESQKLTESHLESASLYHTKAALELNEGNYEQAAQNALLAQKYLDLASKKMREVKTNENP
jgi:hypothetical protein